MWGRIRQYLNWRQIVLLAITLFVLPFWLLNYESILQHIELDRVFVEPGGRFMTVAASIINFLQSGFAKGLITGALVIAFLPMLTAR